MHPGPSARTMSPDQGLSRWRSAFRVLTGDLRQGSAFAACLIRARLAARYRHSVLGFCWVLAPALTSSAFLFTGMRARIVHESVDGIPAPLFVALGVLLVQGLTEGFSAQAEIFAQARVWFQRRPVQVESLVLAGLGEVLVGALLRWAVAVGLVVWWGSGPAWGMFAALAGFIGLGLAGSGLGLLMAPWVALSPDCRQAARFVPLVLFASAPVFWPANSNHGLAVISKFNPFSPLLTQGRALMVLSGESASVNSLLLGSGASVASLLLGWMLVRSFAPAVMERTTT